MDGGSRSKASAVLGVLADLSPSAQQHSSALVVPLDWFSWVPALGVRLFQPPLDLQRPEAQLTGSVGIDRRVGERLAAIDRIRPGQQRSLRAGWLFVAGRRAAADGRMQRVFTPLLSVPVRIVLPLLGDAHVLSAGDVQASELVTDPIGRHALEAGYELGGGALEAVPQPVIPADLLRRLDRLRSFARSAAAAAGFEARSLRAATASPEELLRGDGLTIVAGVGMYTTGEVGGLSAAQSLRTWADRDLLVTNSFSALYLGTGPVDDVDFHNPEVVAPFPLTPTQRAAVARSRSAPVSVISGAAGTGKSHTVSAIACDAVGRGETVLVATKSDAAVDALLALLGEAPGLDPVVFGSSERRDDLARRLASGVLEPVPAAVLESATASLQAGLEARREVVARIADRLQAEWSLEHPPSGIDEARLVGPGCFDPDCDLMALRRLLDMASSTTGWWARRLARHAVQQAAALMGAPPGASLADLRAAAAVAERVRAAGDLLACGGLDLATDWARLEALNADVHDLVTRWLASTSRSPKRLDRASLAAVAVLATALRSGRAARREQLTRLDQDLSRALPLWVGTLGDVEDLLPPRPSLFDLVILDEASAIDQPLAAPALLRARRAVVVGDPHQLRHVSFLADEQLRRAAREHGLDDDPVLVGRLDVRRNSIFDVAVGAAPATVLDEHFRSAPHLIDFVARRLYDGRLRVATRSPATENCDCIDIVRLSAKRSPEGVVQREVDEVMSLLRQLSHRGERSVGVITPFRAQADALEAAVLETFSVHDLESLDLRVGTVHAFQGNERDVVLVSLGIGEGDTAATWRFAEDPHLFAVLATRARRRLVMLLSASPPPGGLISRYLAQADAPPGRPAPSGSPEPWAASVAGWLAAAGIPTLPGYPTGRHVVDVCAGSDRRFLGLTCGVHPDGPAAHVERHLALRRAGWELADTFSSRWTDRQGELVLDLADRLRSHG